MTTITSYRAPSALPDVEVRVTPLDAEGWRREVWHHRLPILCTEPTRGHPRGRCSAADAVHADTDSTVGYLREVYIAGVLAHRSVNDGAGGRDYAAICALAIVAGEVSEQPNTDRRRQLRETVGGRHLYALTEAIGWGQALVEQHQPPKITP